MRHGTRPVTLRTRWLTIGEGGHVSNSSSIYGTRRVKILWSMLPPLKLLNSSGPTRIPSYLKSNSTVCRPGETARPGEAQASNLQACGGCDMHLAQRIGAELAITGTLRSRRFVRSDHCGHERRHARHYRPDVVTHARLAGSQSTSRAWLWPQAALVTQLT